ncbi:hypothetical protein D043_4788, partial [Vibrio parahaemolyticus EKP-021]
MSFAIALRSLTKLGSFSAAIRWSALSI